MITRSDSEQCSDFDYFTKHVGILWQTWKISKHWRFLTKIISEHQKNMQQFNRHRLFVAWRQLIFNRNHSESQIIVFCLRRSKSRTSSGLYLFGSGLWRTVIELLSSIILIVFSFLLSFLKFQNVCACSLSVQISQQYFLSCLVCSPPKARENVL